MLVPENIRSDLMELVFVPLYEAFFRLLNLTAGPVIFLSLLWALCGVGNPSVGARSRNMFLRCMSFSLLLTVSTLVISAFIFHPNQSADAVRGRDFAGVLDALLQLIPSDLFSPFIDGESAQLLFLALLLGSAVLIMGSKSDRLKEIVEEGNNLGSLLAEWVSVISPAVIAVMAVIETWCASFRMLISSIWPLLLLVVFYAVMLAVSVLCTSVKYRVSAKNLWRKLKPSCMIALRHASVNAAYGASKSCCTKKLGLPSDFVSYALPSGLVLLPVLLRWKGVDNES